MEHDESTIPRQYHGVMVSSTFTDLAGHRAALIKAIDSQGLKAIAMENDSAKPDGDVLDSSLNMVRDGAAYVGVISRKYGQTPECPKRNPNGLSLSELEFNEAQRLGRPIFLFIMGKGHHVTEDDVELDPDKRKKLEAFRENAKRASPDSTIHRVYKEFNDLHEFEVAAMQAVAGLAAYLKEHPPIQPARNLQPSKSKANPGIPTPPAFYAEPPYIGSHPFLGRRAQLETLDDWASPANSYPVLLFEAIGGTGKSILTWHWVNHHALKVRGDWAGRFWYSFYERGAVMADFCQRALAYMTGQALADLSKKKISELSELLLRELQARPWLLILDGLERILVSYHRYDAAQLPDEQAGIEDIIAHRDPCAAIRPEDDELLRLLVAAAPSKLLITTRLTPKILLNAASQPIPGILRERLSGLRPQDAEDLLKACGIRGESGAIQAYLQEHCDCHPLVTGVLAGLIHDYLPDRGNFDAWAKDSDGGGKLNLAKLDLVQKRNHILLYSIETLPETSRQLIFTLALLSESFDYATLSAFNPHNHTDPQGSAETNRNSSPPKKPRMPTQRLAETVKDLEKRGLLQYDPGPKRYNLHPVVRGVAFGRLGREETQIYGRKVVDYFSRHVPMSYQEVETLETLSGDIQIIRTLLKMEHYKQAFFNYQGELARALLFNVEAYDVTLSLLRPFFPNGWTSQPHKLNETDATCLAKDVGGILNEIGSTKESLHVFSAALRNSLQHSDWKDVAGILSNISMIFSCLDSLALEDRYIRASLTLAELLLDRELLFRIRLLRFNQLAVIGSFEGAEELWLLLGSMGRDFSRAIYRPGYAERSYAWFQYYRQTLQEKHIRNAERLAKQGRNRLSIREIYNLQGSWKLDQKEWHLAVESLQKSVHMSRAIGQDDPAIETRLAIAKFHLGQLSNPQQEAEKFANSKNVAHRPLAELWLALGEQELAVLHALAAYRWAWADGEPYVHRFELNRAAALLDKDLVKNNFPKSMCLRNGAIVPAREEVVEDNPHGFEEICGHFFSRRIEAGQ